MTPPRSKGRHIRPTLLLVGEGEAECELLRCLRSLYTRDHQGLRVVIRNARGGGARSIIDYAIRQLEQADYDRAAALLDTDTAWPIVWRKRAQAKRLLLLGSEPCIEALLLQVVGVQVSGTSAELKKRFRLHFNGQPHDDGLIARHYTREVWDQARGTSEVLARLISLMSGED
jgi:hypothetical protein